MAKINRAKMTLCVAFELAACTSGPSPSLVRSASQSILDRDSVCAMIDRADVPRSRITPAGKAKVEKALAPFLHAGLLEFNLAADASDARWKSPKRRWEHDILPTVRPLEATIPLLKKQALKLADALSRTCCISAKRPTKDVTHMYLQR